MSFGSATDIAGHGQRASAGGADGGVGDEGGGAVPSVASLLIKEGSLAAATMTAEAQRFRSKRVSSGEGEGAA